MIELINELEALNVKFRSLLTTWNIKELYESLSMEDKERFIETLHVSVNNAKILTNNILKNEWK
jgi:hypothetical protein